MGGFLIGNVNRTLAGILAAGLVVLLGLSGSTQAVAPANAPITSTAQVSYDGLQTPESASVGFTVELSPSAPDLSASADQQVEVEEEEQVPPPPPPFPPPRQEREGASVKDCSDEIIATFLQGLGAWEKDEESLEEV